jgi:hypothetical protein
MSAIARRARECLRKRAYESSGRAMLALCALVQRDGEAGLVVYACRHAEHWHLGHARKGARRGGRHTKVSTT